MLKFNNTHLFTGYLKHLLANTNLPTYKIYTRENKLYKQTYGVESPEILETVPTSTYSYKNHIRYIPYIKDGNIAEYIFTENPASTNAENAKGTYAWKIIDNYYPDKKSLNHTKTLRITSNIYDSYTHEYLGDYLRFLRDYYNVDLMSLYNCFSNKICQNLYIECLANIAEGKYKQHFIFNAADKDYKIYMIPVKFFKEYTIAIDCEAEVEVCCGIYGKYQDTLFDSYNNLPHTTYKRYSNLRFNQPVLYSPLTAIRDFLTKESLIELAPREKDLKLFIKIPAHNNSSIVILEGNYLGYNDRFTKHIKEQAASGEITYPWHEFKNHCVLNFESAEHIFISEEEYLRTRNFKPISTLQLLTMNTGISYPFADRLIEYLMDNAITPLDTVEDNIIRTQRIVASATTDRIKKSDGLWDERMRPVLYNFMQTDKHVDQAVNHDILGYVDKDVEQLYNAPIKDPVTGTFINRSIANIDIYPDIYKNQKDNN